MSITQDGIDAEKEARLFLNAKGIYDIQQFDWFIKKENKYYIIEVKNRELFKPPPFWGTGLDIAQIKKRIQVFNDLGIDTILLVFEKDTENIYFAYLSKLEKTIYYDTKNKIRIYNIENFKKDKQ